MGKPAEFAALEMSGFELLRSNMRHLFNRFYNRYIPRLVWVGQEVDVRVCFTKHPLGDPEAPRLLYDAERNLRTLGLSFDTSSGFDGRDWEWDWSLKGPIKVTFRAVRKEPRPQIGSFNEGLAQREQDLIQAVADGNLSIGKLSNS